MCGIGCAVFITIASSLPALDFSFLYILSPSQQAGSSSSCKVMAVKFLPDGSVQGLPMGFQLVGSAEQLVAGEAVDLMQTTFLGAPLPTAQKSPFPFTHKGWILDPDGSKASLVVLTPTGSLPEALNGPIERLFAPEPVPDTLTVLLTNQPTMAADPFPVSA